MLRLPKIRLWWKKPQKPVSTSPTTGAPQITLDYRNFSNNRDSFPNDVTLNQLKVGSEGLVDVRMED